MDVRHQLQWIEHDMRRAVTEWLLELVDDLAALVGGETLIGNGRPGDVTAEFFELVTLVGVAAGGRVKGEAGLLREQGGCEGFRLHRDGAQGQCFAAGIEADGDAVVDGRADKLIKRLTGFEVEEGVVRVTDEEALSFQQLGHSHADAVQQLRELGGSRPGCAVKRRSCAIE